MKQFILTFLLLSGLASTIYAQSSSNDATEIKEMQWEKKLENIRNDLQEKKLQYSWQLTENYMAYCRKLSQINDINREPRLTQLATSIRPQELEPLRLAHETASKELDVYLHTFPEYVTLDSLSKKSPDETISKNAEASLKVFYKQIYKEDTTYVELLLKRRLALKKHYIAAVDYLLKECKRDKTVMPDALIPYNIEKQLRDSDMFLQQLYLEIQNLQKLQNEAIREYQQLKYGIQSK